MGHDKGEGVEREGKGWEGEVRVMKTYVEQDEWFSLVQAIGLEVLCGCL